ncbi:MAG: hypothetical protein GX907_05620 [Clostridiaceae bacterium]|nr:hypothetical protein [Clostridiaceae bacterium]
MAVHETEDGGNVTDYPLKNESYIDLLCRYTKKQMFKITENLNDYIKTSLRKADYAAELVVLATRRFREFMYSANSKDLQIIAELMSDESKPFSSRKDIPGIVWIMVQFGFAILAYSESLVKHYIVIPKEIRKIYEEISTSETTESKRELITHARSVLSALANLYGIYRYEHFLEIWQSLYGTAYSEDELMGAAQTGVWYLPSIVCLDQYIIQAILIDEPSIFDIYRKASRYSYYLPTIEDIATYKDTYVVRDTPEYDALLNFLAPRASQGHNLDLLLQVLGFAILTDKTPAEIIDFLSGDNIFFASVNDVNRCLQLLADWKRNMRLWVTRGHKASELSAEA